MPDPVGANRLVRHEKPDPAGPILLETLKKPNPANPKALGTQIIAPEIKANHLHCHHAHNPVNNSAQR